MKKQIKFEMTALLVATCLGGAFYSFNSLDLKSFFEKNNVVHVTTKYMVAGSDSGVNYIIDNTLSQAELAIKFKKPNILGMTSTRFKRSIVQRQAGFSLDLAISAQTVYIPSEFTKGSCAYNEILNHELTHVKATDDALSHTVDIAKNSIKQINQNTNEPEVDILPYIQSNVIPLVDSEFSAKKQEIDKEIDSDEEYTRLGRVCKGITMRVILANLNKTQNQSI